MSAVQYDSAKKEPLIGTILRFASVPLKKIGTRLLGFCWPCQCVLPLLHSEAPEWEL